MSHFNEHTLEMAIMELFEQQGYSYVDGQTIHKEQTEVLLRDDVRMYLMDRYAEEGITPLEVERIMAKLTADDGAPLYEQNAQTYRMMTEGFTIKREDASLPDLFVEVIDFKDVDRNIFKIVNQLEIKGTEKRIPDGIVYVNGLPVVVLEFKSAVKEDTTIMNAYTQLTVRYRRDIPELFRYNAFVVISDGVNNKYGTLFTPYEFFYAWRKVERTDKANDGIDSLHTMMEGLFRKDRLLSVMKDFVFFQSGKIVCRYPQFFATHRLYENILEHSHINLHGDGKGGTWRMPTDEKWMELRENCTFERVYEYVRNNYYWLLGCKVTSTNGNSIFLPSPDYNISDEILFTGSNGDEYWSSTLAPDNKWSSSAYGLTFDGYDEKTYSNFMDRSEISRYYPRPVRPVKP